MAATPNAKGVTEPAMYTYSDLDEFAKLIQSKTHHKPSVGIVCGSGLGGLADKVEEQVIVKYSDIPHFPVSTVKGHQGQFVIGKLGGHTVICMKGRFHSYEGYPPWKLTAPVRVMSILGVKTLFVTNAAGSIDKSYQVGDIMIMKDHLYFPGLAGLNPLIGPNMEEFGERFMNTSNLYDRKLRQLARDIINELGHSDILREGTYTMVCGPSFETPAELKLLSSATNVVGMSTCPEAIVAKHCGMRVFGLSLITNKCIMDPDVTEADGPSHLDVLEIGRKRQDLLQGLVADMIRRMDGN